MENGEGAFATSLTRGPVPRWQRKALEAKPSSPQVDRFIPNRSSMNLDEAHFHLTAQESEDLACSPSKQEYQRGMKSNLFNSSNEQASKILTFKQKAPKPTEGFQNDLRVLYSQNKTGSVKAAKVARHISQAPDRILDAPELKADFYLNLLDWSSQNTVAVALNDTVYLWNAANGAIEQLCQFENDYVSSVSWVADGNYLAVGTNESQVQIWDVTAQKKVRSLNGHESRVAAMDWNEHVLSTGSKSGVIVNHDVRIQEHAIARLQNHTQEVCGLKWSPDGKQLASGGNDNLVNIWNANGSVAHTFNQHQAAVKALAWCPWQSNLLVTGGGTADRHLRFWNTASGACINAVDTKSQISSVMWNKEYRELITGHGFSNNQLTIWKYPTMTKVQELQGHTQRVISLAMSPDGSTVMSAAADETLRIWKCFASDDKKKVAKKVDAPASRLTAMIR